MANIISNKALKLKFNPSQKQYSQFLQSFGCERFVYNFYLAEKNNFYEKEIKPLGNDKKARNAVWKTFKEKTISKKKPLPKDTSSVLSIEELANLALSLGSTIGNARNKSTHAEVV